MRIRYDFLPQGAVIVPWTDRWVYSNPGGEERVFDPRRTVICDVGNLLRPGVIDQHAVEWQGMCTTALIADEPEEYLANIDPGADEITLVTHLEPDFDAAAALFLTRYYLENGELPEFAFTLAKYAQSVDSGRFQLDPAAPLSPAALVIALGYLSGTGQEDDREKSTRALLEMFRFFEAWPDLLLKSSNSFGPNFLSALRGFEDALDLINEDVFRYTRDIDDRSRIVDLNLLNLTTRSIDEVQCIVTHSPRSMLWKDWARNDRGKSRHRAGFPVTCGFFDTYAPRTRAIIATNPNLPYHLKGLGLLLDKLEMDALRASGVGDPVGDYPRPGFVRANPWYDGRNALHKFTIIDAPSGGSLLAPDIILRALKKSSAWSRLSDNFDQYNTAAKIGEITVV